MTRETFIVTPGGGNLLHAWEVARMFGVDAKTVTRWANAGKLRSVRTPGGHRRYYRAEIEAMLNEGQERTR